MRREPKASRPAATEVAAKEKSALPGRLWFVLLCAAVLFAPWLGGMLTGVGPAAARALVAAAGIAWVADRWGKWTMPRPAAWLWIFIGWSFLTAFRGTNWHDSLTALSNLISYAILATLAADAARQDEKGWRREALATSLLLGLGAVGAQGMWDGLHNVAGWRVFGPFTTPNLYASYLITSLGLGLFLLIVFSRALGDALEGRKTPQPDTTTPNQESGFARWFGRLADDQKLGVGCLIIAAVVVVLAVIPFLGLTALMMTASKGAILALLAGALGSLLVTGFWRRVNMITVVLVAISVALAALIGGDTLLGRVEAAAAGEAHSGQFRVLTWEASARMAAANPVLGTGIGTFGSAFNRYAIAGWTEAAHNAYLQTAAETGVPGLLLFLAALGSSALWLLRAARSEDRTVALLGAAGLAGLLAAAAHNLVDYGWTLWAPSAALWTLIGLGVGEEDRARRPVPRLAAIGMLVPLFATLIGGILVANAASLADPASDPSTKMTATERVAALESARRLDPLDADLARRLAVAYAQAGDQEAALATLGEAVRLAPGEPTAWRYLGEGYENLNRMEKAREAFDQGLSHAPKSQKLLLDAAELADRTGRRHESIGYYRRIVAVQEGPSGEYPATPEIVPVEPLYAYAALAAEADRTAHPEEARRYRKALIALADRYETNRAKYPLIWQATGQDRPDILAAVRQLRAEAVKALGRRS